MVSKVSAANNASVVSNTWGGGGGGEGNEGGTSGWNTNEELPLDELHFHNWIHYDGVTF